MRRSLVLPALGTLLLTSLLLGGCDGERRPEAGPPTAPADPGHTPLPEAADPAILASFDLDVGRVDVLSATVDRDRGRITVDTAWAPTGERRLVSIRPDRAVRSGRGFLASIEDRRELRFGVGFRWSAVEPGRFRIVEWTDRDRLTLDSAPLGEDGVRERYVWNGKEAVFEASARDIEAGNLGKRSEWSRFYPGSSLDHNLEGERLVQVVFEERFVRWLHRHLGGQDDVVERTDGIGDWLTVCAAFKCALGGVANPVCHACFGGSIAIAVGNLLCETVADCK